MDPKGVEYPENAIMKINGFNQFKEQISRNNKIIIDFKLSYFHAIKPEIMEDYKEYWTNDLDKIF